MLFADLPLIEIGGAVIVGLIAVVAYHYRRPKWKRMADDPFQRIAAMKVYRDQHGSTLAEAKEAVDDYIRSTGRSPTPE
jgi:hypothetical protein